MIHVKITINNLVRISIPIPILIKTPIPIQRCCEMSVGLRLARVSPNNLFTSLSRGMFPHDQLFFIE
jgi:hypothetical protein